MSDDASRDVFEPTEQDWRGEWDEPDLVCGSCGAELGFDADDLCPCCGEPIS